MSLITLTFLIVSHTPFFPFTPFPPRSPLFLSPYLIHIRTPVLYLHHDDHVGQGVGIGIQYRRDEDFTREVDDVVAMDSSLLSMLQVGDVCVYAYMCVWVYMELWLSYLCMFTCFCMS